MNQKNGARGCAFNIFICLIIVLALHIPYVQAVERQPGRFPDKILTIVVPGSPGGIAHLLGTTMARALEQELDVQGLDVKVNIAARPGNSGIRAIEYYMSLPPNGYTILQQIDTVASQYAACEISVNPLVDLTPLATVQITFSQLYIRSGDPRFNSWETLLSFVKRNPGRVKVAQFGKRGSMESVLLEALEDSLGLEFEKISFARSSRRYLSIIQKETDVLIEQPGDIRFFLNQDLLKPVLTLLPQHHEPHPELPMTPSFSDIAVESETLYRFRGFFVHSDTPKDRLAVLERALKKAFDTQVFRDYNETKYMSLLGSSYRDIEGSKKLVGDAMQAYKRILGRTGECERQ